MSIFDTINQFGAYAEGQLTQAGAHFFTTSILGQFGTLITAALDLGGLVLIILGILVFVFKKQVGTALALILIALGIIALMPQIVTIL